MRWILNRSENSPIDHGKNGVASHSTKTWARMTILFVFLIAIAVSVDAREWTDKNGRTYQGDFSGLVNGQVEIDNNGRIFRIPLTDLSDEDQAFVREQVGQQQGGGNNQGNGQGGGNQNNRPVQDNQGGGAAPAINVPRLNDREWTDSNNNRLNGRFGGLVDETTVRILHGGSSTDVPLANLSQADQAYVQEVVAVFDPRVHGRIWSPTDGTALQGTFIQINNTDVWILTSFSDDKVEIEAVLLSPADLAFVCDVLNRRVTTPPRIDGEQFRVWTHVNANWRAIGRLADYSDSQLLIEQEDGSIRISLADLSAEDQAYARERLPDIDEEEDEDKKDEEGDEDKNKKFKDSGFDWSRYYAMHPVFYIIFAVSVLGLIAAISFKYISESFQDDD